eukprot:CAMPEP_0185847186 /NCGR_PEP_ID=MMETSP1354-20130828/2561_1 /TAXON_ID=708628 /ORGANISM="Erythrolobus madagascarensis, Strain CCMP3276" /LENGTH=254 /DNA_ID=CAMNT_0028547449 /DNA_START=240 /DNA_END=1004 /DNA_ORIENTATION=-
MLQRSGSPLSAVRMFAKAKGKESGKNTMGGDVVESSGDVDGGGDDGEVDEIKAELRVATKGIRMGFDLGEDVGGDDDDDIEELLEELETKYEKREAVSVGKGDAAEDQDETQEIDFDLLVGDWSLQYTSSTLARFTGGLSSLHKLVPRGRSVKIVMSIKQVDSDAMMFETVRGAGGIGTQIKLWSKWRVKGPARFALEHDKIEYFKLKRFADSWKPLRAFSLFDVTHLDRDSLVARGQAGQVYYWAREEDRTTV